MRRDFFQFHASTKSPLAAEVLARVATLYAIEAEIRGQSAERRRRILSLSTIFGVKTGKIEHRI